MKDKLRQIIPYIFGVVLFAMIAFQFYHYNQFIAKGPRFTAFDGQELCEKVRELEAVSYGFKDSGKPQLTCDYVKRAENTNTNRNDKK